MCLVSCFIYHCLSSLCVHWGYKASAEKDRIDAAESRLLTVFRVKSICTHVIISDMITMKTVPINRKQDRGGRKRQTTTRHAMTSMSVEATECPSMPNSASGVPAGLGRTLQIVWILRYTRLSPWEGSVCRTKWQPHQSSPAWIKDLFMTFLQRATGSSKHTQRERVDGKFRIIWREEEKEKDREHGRGSKASKGIQYHSWKPFPTCRLLSRALNLQQEVIVCMRLASPCWLTKYTCLRIIF